MKPIGLTLDVCILMSASGAGADDHHDACVALLELIEATTGAEIVIDDGGKIAQHYSTKIHKGDFGFEFVQRMSSSRVQSTKRASLNSGQKAALQAAGIPLNNEDYKNYIRTTAGSPTKILITFDSDYTSERVKVIKKILGVAVLDEAQAIGLLKARKPA